MGEWREIHRNYYVRHEDEFRLAADMVLCHYIVARGEAHLWSGYSKDPKRSAEDVWNEHRGEPPRKTAIEEWGGLLWKDRGDHKEFCEWRGMTLTAAADGKWWLRMRDGHVVENHDCVCLADAKIYAFCAAWAADAGYLQDMDQITWGDAAGENATPALDGTITAQVGYTDPLRYRLARIWNFDASTVTDEQIEATAKKLWEQDREALSKDELELKRATEHIRALEGSVNELEMELGDLRRNLAECQDENDELKSELYGLTRGRRGSK